MKHTTVIGPDGSFSGYLALPQSGSGPGMVVIQEIFGVNAFVQDIADGFAAQGYIALAPDLFWRQEPGIQLTDKTEAERQRAFQLYQGSDEAAGLRDLQTTLTHLRGIAGCSGKTGTVGFCLGGKLAYLCATRTDADCSVGYYGVGIERALDEASCITKPFLLHIASLDQYCPKEAQAQIHTALDTHPMVTLHDYSDADHAFARTGGAHYNQAAGDLANQRTTDLFKACLW